MCVCVCVRPGSRQPVHLLSPSEDGKWLATANTDCEIHVYNLHKMKVSSVVCCGRSAGPVLTAVVCVCVCLQLHCTVPVYGSCPTAVAIHPTTSHLISVHADQQVSAAAAAVRLC